MATAQKRGFRFPWGGDARNDEPPPEPGDDASDDSGVAHRPGTASDDLGAGPFGLSTGQAADQAEPPADIEDAEPEPQPVEAAAPPTPVASTTEATATPRQPDAGAVLGLDQAAWPESDRRTTGPLAAATAVPATTPRPATSAAGAPPPAPVAPASSPRRDNPLVAGLVRAMRDAARTARDETVATLHADAAARAEAIRAQSAVAVEELRKAAEADVAALKDWSRAELARVRAETEERINARRGQLVEDTEAAGRAAEELVQSLGATVEAFEAEMAGFFDVLLAEEDPARLAGLAERMPAAPILDAFAGPDDAIEAGARPRRSSARSASSRVAEPEEPPVETTTAPAAALDGADDASAASMPEATDADAGEPVDGQGVEAEGTVASDDPRLGWLGHLDADDAAAAEAEALAGLDRQTNVVVSGLASVAGIAGFKGALMHVSGVSAVSVTAGANGDVLFTVTHDGQVELRDAVRGMEAFAPQVIADDGDTLSVVAREPAA